MVDRVLTGAGFIKNKTYKETKFVKAPKSTYAVYLHSFRRRGADGLNLIKENDYTIELYSYKADPTSEKNIESSFDNLGLEYEKSDRIWIESEGLYQVVYTFNTIEK